jgi:transcriptional regulator with XRE-family HTH domain
MIKNTATVTTVKTQGQRIRVARKAKGLTQVELASLAGTTQQAIAGYETGRRGHGNPNLGVLVKIAKVLSVSIDWLLTGREKKEDNKDKTSQDFQSIKTNMAPIIGWNDIRLWTTYGRENMNL